MQILYTFAGADLASPSSQMFTSDRWRGFGFAELANVHLRPLARICNPCLYSVVIRAFVVVFCSFLLLVQKKRTKEKDAGNDNRSLFVRPLHNALTRHQKGCGSHRFRFALAL